MSTEALMEINAETCSQNIFDIVTKLNRIGWSCYNADGLVEYLPLNDNDCFDWQAEPLTEEEVRWLIETKQGKAEKIGINFFHKYSEHGFSFLADSTKNILLSFNINRKRLPDDDNQRTDVGWYVENIIQKLQEENCLVACYRFEEYI